MRTSDPRRVPGGGKRRPKLSVGERFTTWGRWALGTCLVSSVVAASGLVPTALAGDGPAAAANVGGASGIVTVSVDLSETDIGEPIYFDPTLGDVEGEQAPWQLPIYSTLLRPTPSGAAIPELATSVSIIDPSTVAIKLRKGVVFSDGTPFNSQAVRAGLLRNEATNNPVFNTATKTIASIDTPTSTSLTVHLSQPDAGAFYAVLSQSDSFIPSPRAVASGNLNAHPVGAGPFILKQYVPNSKIVLVRNPKYWAAKSIHVNEIEYINVSPGASQLTALESGLVDTGQVQVDGLAAVRNNSSLRAISVPAQPSVLIMPVCKTQAPFNNVRVRQALSYAINRPAIVRSVLSGAGQPAWAIWPQGSIFFPKNLAGYYSYKPSKAKALLKQAGYPNGFSASVAYSSGSTSSAEVAAILQQEWKQIGVNVSLVPTANLIGEFFEGHDAPIGISPGVKAGLGALEGPFTPGGGVGNVCNYSNPYLNGIVSQLAQVAPTSAKAVALWNQAQNFVVKNALSIWIAFQPDVFAASRNLSGVQYLVSAFPVPVVYFWTLSTHGT